jgi:uncharacterized protein
VNENAGDPHSAGCFIIFIRIQPLCIFTAGNRFFLPEITRMSPSSTYLESTDRLPLTCTRGGTCCHGKIVWLNPWELACMAKVKGLAPRVFRDRYCEFGGIRLLFGATPQGRNGLGVCSQYLPDSGCSVHAGRPLVCRLFPLGREQRGKEVRHLHRGNNFPCLAECPEVADLPYVTVSDYLKAQDVVAHEAALDAYLDLMQRLADSAFALLLESGLAAAGDRRVLPLWRKLGNMSPGESAGYSGGEWVDRLMVPEIGDGPGNPVSFAQRHHDLLQAQAQEAFGTLDDVTEAGNASGKMMGLALHLSRGLGINPADLAEKWIGTAKELGARE